MPGLTSSQRPISKLTPDLQAAIEGVFVTAEGVERVSPTQKRTHFISNRGRSDGTTLQQYANILMQKKTSASAPGSILTLVVCQIEPARHLQGAVRRTA